MTHMNLKKGKPEAFIDIGKMVSIMQTMKRKRKAVNKSDAVAMMLASFACGLTIGFLISPARAGFGNNVNNTTNHYYLNADTTKS